MESNKTYEAFKELCDKYTINLVAFLLNYDNCYALYRWHNRKQVSHLREEDVLMYHKMSKKEIFKVLKSRFDVSS